MILKNKILKISFKFKSFHHKNFKKVLNKILNKLNTLQLAKTSGVVSLPTKIERFTVLRSPHIDKKSREQFEIKSYNKLITIKLFNKNFNYLLKLKLLLNFIKNSCGGIQIKIIYNN